MSNFKVLNIDSLKKELLTIDIAWHSDLYNHKEYYEIELNDDVYKYLNKKFGHKFIDKTYYTDLKLKEFEKNSHKSKQCFVFCKSIFFFFLLILFILPIVLNVVIADC